MSHLASAGLWLDNLQTEVYTCKPFEVKWGFDDTYRKAGQGNFSYEVLRVESRDTQNDDSNVQLSIAGCHGQRGEYSDSAKSFNVTLPGDYFRAGEYVFVLRSDNKMWTQNTIQIKDNGDTCDGLAPIDNPALCPLIYAGLFETQTFVNSQTSTNYEAPSQI
ncbi:hypothetical protein EV182_000443 [Spiromyces aspiralis]|uniref:Uncharacterized protein n=1 Tax=Spiromyces aspiralis TaxID=68401 RepID=A0ACC1HL15_9FUNG|nr:hypothetical protein EV182_000443 [Spiromyces aspiralis]